jgi:hypothetical protein
MKLKTLTVATVAIFALGIGPLTSAKQPEALVELSPGKCNVGLGTQFATWSWEEGGLQTKFGGDAVYEVTATLNGDSSLLYGPYEIEVELVRYEPGTDPGDFLSGDAGDYPGFMVYACGTAEDPENVLEQAGETAEAGSCVAQIVGFEQVLKDKVTSMLEEQAMAYPDEGDEVDLFEVELLAVNVKAMNPGVVMPGERRPARQNYPLTNVCESELDS